MSAPQEVTLFDLPSKPPTRTWSLNPWKIRLYLNYKQIPYRTEWIEYPDLVDRLSPHMDPNPPGSFASYTIPTVILPDGKYVQESVVIARRLEELYPAPTVQIDTKYLDVLMEIVPQIMRFAAPEYLSQVPKRLLGEACRTWWYPDRERRAGSNLDDLQREKGGDVVSRATAPHVKKIAELLKENPGPYLEGNELTYADLVWAALLRFFMTIGRDVFDCVICEEQDTHLEFLAKFAPLFARDDH